MGSRKAWYLAVAVTLMAGTAAWTVESQDRIDNLTVRGEGRCAVPTGHPAYALNWVVINPEANGPIRITSATQSGAYEGEVDVRPNPLPSGESGKAGDGPVPGDTEGAVTLTVDYVTSGGEKGRSSGSLFLEGNCRLPDRGSGPETGPSRVDAPRPTQVDEPLEQRGEDAARHFFRFTTAEMEASVMGIRKSSSLAGAIVLAVGLTAAWVDAPEPPADLMIRGNSVCDPDGTYSLNWIVINPEVNTEVTISSAAQSGAFKGEVYLDPSRLKANQSATGGMAVPGKTKGTVVLTVSYVFNDTGGEAESSGSVHLDGTCKKSSDSSGPWRVDGNRPTRVDDD